MATNENDKAVMRQFGCTMAGVLPLVFGLLIPWLWDASFPRWPWLLAAVFLVLALFAPSTLAPVYVVWMKFGHGMNWVISRLALSFVFYAVVLPIGLIMRLAGNDPMSRRPMRGETYRTPSEKLDRKHLERPF